MDKIKKIGENEYTIRYSSYISDFLQAKNLITKITPIEITFVANKIEKLYTSCFTQDVNFMKQVIYDLGFQFLTLKSENKTIQYLNIDDMILINDRIILFTNYDLICDFDIDGYFILQTKYNNYSNLYSPEFTKSSIGDKLFHTSLYYSFALLIMEIFDVTLYQLENTKFYFSIKKLMHLDPIKRTIIYI
jgi:hypothetical protein